MRKAVVTAPRRDLSKYRACNERAEKPLRHARECVYEIAFAIFLDHFFCGRLLLFAHIGKDAFVRLLALLASSVFIASGVLGAVCVLNTIRIV